MIVYPKQRKTDMDKIAKLRQEIDKRYAEYRAKMKTDDFTYYEGMADALDLFEQFLDTLSEEPDKSLEEAADKHARFYDQGTCDGIAQDCFIAGAKWQKEQDNRDMFMSDNRHFNKVYELGKKDMKEQMLKGAVDVQVVGEQRDLRLINSTQRCLFNAKRGDWLEIIIVKEEEK